MSVFNLQIPDELIEHVAAAIADRALQVIAARLKDPTPWMTTDEAIAYTRIAAGTFDTLAASGRIPSHSADGGRRKLYHRNELDQFLGYGGHRAPSRERSAMRLDAA